MCEQCPLHGNVSCVPGSGPSGDWFFVGEAPGEEEDKSLVPFVGKAGRRFNALLEHEAGLARASVYVTNVERHRPPGNRPPRKSEIVACLSDLKSDLMKVRPKYVVAMGAKAIGTFKKGVKLAAEHGKGSLLTNVLGTGLDVMFVPWYHPAYSFRNPGIIGVMTSDAQRLRQEVAGTAEVPTNYTLGLDSMDLKGVKQYGFDTETTSPQRGGVFQTGEAELVGYSIAVERGRAAYVPLRERDGDGGSGLFAAGRLERLKGIVEDQVVGGSGYEQKGLDRGVCCQDGGEVPHDGSFQSDKIDEFGSKGGCPHLRQGQEVGLTKVCHNAKFEYKVLSKAGIELTNFHDTKLAAYLLGEYSTSLKDLTRQHLGTEPITYAQLTKGRGMETLDPHDILPYAAADADNTLALWKLLEPRLRSEGLWDVYEKIELPLVPVLAEMEQQGVRIDTGKAAGLLSQLHDLHTLSKDYVASALAIENPVSHEQLSKALEGLGCPIRARTPGKHLLVTDDDALKAVRQWNTPLIDAILDMRKYQKLGGYVSGFINLTDDSGYLHTSFNQAGSWEEYGRTDRSAPATGRLSSSGPNLQNIPHHGDVRWAMAIRSLIQPRPGHLFLSADLEQEEPRIIALVAGDEELRRAFAERRDIYRRATEAVYPHTRCELDDREWKVKYEEERYKGKTIFLAWYYGAGAPRIRDIEPAVSNARAQAIIRRLRAAHPARERYVAEIAEQVKREGFVRTWFGRKRWLPTAMSHNRKDVGAAVREACNMPIQGTAADVLKIAMRRIRDGLRGLDSRLVLTVHDEVGLDVLPSEVDKVREVVYNSFQGLLPIELPIEFKVGASLGEVR